MVVVLILWWLCCFYGGCVDSMMVALFLWWLCWFYGNCVDSMVVVLVHPSSPPSSYLPSDASSLSIPDATVKLLLCLSRC